MLVPWELVLLFKFDQKFALKVKELVESRKKVVNCVLIDYILLHERTGVVLLTQKERNQQIDGPPSAIASAYRLMEMRRLPA